jgi:hypothetical protein
MRCDSNQEDATSVIIFVAMSSTKSCHHIIADVRGSETIEVGGENGISIALSLSPPKLYKPR